MRIQAVTIFPELFRQALAYGILGRAQEQGRFDFGATDIRDFAWDRHRSVDDRPFGGGPGMVMGPDAVAAAVDAARSAVPREAPVVFLSPQGAPLSQAGMAELADLPGLVLLCGRYEGVDERVRETRVDRELSVGDYVLSGGEFAALTVIDAVVRLLPGVVGEPASVVEDSFADGLLDWPHYTRPQVFEEREVPEVLLSGDHGRIARWRQKEALGRSWLRRPDLLHRRGLTPGERGMLKEYLQERGLGLEGLEGIPHRP